MITELMGKRFLSIVIPAYNEEDRISPTLQAIVDNISSLKEVVVVCDGNDNTPSIAKSYGEKIRVLEFPQKLGRGGAIIQGIKATTGDTVCVIDADNAAPWFEIVRLSSMVDGKNECVVGSRWVKDSKLIVREGTFKIIAGRVWHYLIYLILGLKTKDVQCGLKCFEGNFLRDVINNVTTTNRMFDLALLYNIKIRGVNIREVGIQWSHNTDTRMPYLHVIHIMFLYLIGLRIAHTKSPKKLSKLLTTYRNKFNAFH